MSLCPQRPFRIWPVQLKPAVAELRPHPVFLIVFNKQVLPPIRRHPSSTVVVVIRSPSSSVQGAAYWNSFSIGFRSEKHIQAESAASWNSFFNVLFLLEIVLLALEIDLRARISVPARLSTYATAESPPLSRTRKVAVLAPKQLRAVASFRCYMFGPDLDIVYSRVICFALFNVALFVYSFCLTLFGVASFFLSLPVPFSRLRCSALCRKVEL